MKKIFILGFPHSGTSILKRIIGNAPEVHEHPYETNAITPEIPAAAAATCQRRISPTENSKASSISSRVFRERHSELR